MKNTTWNPPIIVEDPGTGIRRTVKTVRQADKVLHRQWPDTSGSRYRMAETACRQALHEEREIVDARKAFISAAIEAHLRLS